MKFATLQKPNRGPPRFALKPRQMPSPTGLSALCGLGRSPVLPAPSRSGWLAPTTGSVCASASKARGRNVGGGSADPRAGQRTCACTVRHGLSLLITWNPCYCAKLREPEIFEPMTLARKQRTDPRGAPPRPLQRAPAASPLRSQPQFTAMHPLVRARLREDARNDRYEQEADRIAGAVLRMPKPGAGQPAATQGLPAHRRAGFHAPAESGMASLPGRGQPLAQPLRDFFEPRFGYDFSDVRLHTDTRAAGLAESIQARAFAVGKEVVFGVGQFAPETSQGRQLMAHELTHVVQQERGRAIFARDDSASA